ncbi:Glu-tRNA(Gln) amidotransferase subunit GatD [Candidatus Woesearchaeota archaeon]|nr:Glu-tRNA(Gln) amidotransferase subunit GatD [Candidatus Woesearchaeota archaeon]
MVKFTNGDSVEVTTKDKTFSGIYIESNKKDVVTIKLSSGYNIGVNKKEVKKIKLVKKNKKEKTVKVLNVNKGLKKISILHTGGTVASTVDYKTGAVSPRFDPEEIINMFPELNEIATINSRLIGNIWSQDIRFVHFNILAREIKKEIESGAKGIIITHGTDFLHYTSAALSFALKNLPVPVLLVGSQRSSDRGSSDAGMNLINAVYFAVNSEMCDVGICMHNNMNDDYCAILPGLKTRKMHTSRRDAFKTINTKPWALVDYRKGEIKYVDKSFNKKVNGKLELNLFNEKLKIGLLKSTINMDAKQFLFFKNYDGLVIEASGIGNLPTSVLDRYTKDHKKIFNALKILTKKTVVVLAAQTIFGRLNMNVYSNQREMQEIGVLGHLNDMTPETTFVKLSWLLSNYKKDAKDLLFENLKGEINERLMSDEFLDESF